MMKNGVDIGTLEGWLVKKKSKEGALSMFGGDNKRWFKVIELRGMEQKELAFCYFKNQKEKEAKGWIYLKDITEIFDDDAKSFTVVSPSRSITVSAGSISEHRLWLRGLCLLCPWSKSSRISTDLGSAFQQQQARQQELEAKSSPHYPSNYFLDEKYKKLFAEGNAEVADAVPAPLASDRKEQSIKPTVDNTYEGPNNSDDENNNRGNAGLRETRTGRDAKESDHRLNSATSAHSGTNATGRLHEHIKGGTKGPVIQSSASTALRRSMDDDEDGEDDLPEEELAVGQPSQRQRMRTQRNKQVNGSDEVKVAAQSIYGYESETDHRVLDDDVAIHAGERPVQVSDNSGIDAANHSKDPTIKKKKAPPTDDAPAIVRKAADSWRDDSDDDDSKPVRQKRPSIDKVLSNRNTSIKDAKGDNSDEDDVNLQLERERRQMHTMTINADAKSSSSLSTSDFVSPTGSSRPPRPPVAGSKAAPTAALTTAQSGGAGAKSTNNTKRQQPQANAGVTTDSNFATENWDDDEDASADQKSSQRDNRSQEKSAGPVPGVRPDSDWLNEDFDD